MADKRVPQTAVWLWMAQMEAVLVEVELLVEVYKVVTWDALVEVVEEEEALLLGVVYMVVVLGAGLLKEVLEEGKVLVVELEVEEAVVAASW